MEQGPTLDEESQEGDEDAQTDGLDDEHTSQVSRLGSCTYWPM